MLWDEFESKRKKRYQTKRRRFPVKPLLLVLVVIGLIVGAVLIVPPLLETASSEPEPTPTLINVMEANAARLSADQAVPDAPVVVVEGTSVPQPTRLVPTPIPTTPPTAAPVSSGLAAEVIRAANAARDVPLSEASALTQVAQRYSAEFAANGQAQSVDFDRIQADLIAQNYFITGISQLPGASTAPSESAFQDQIIDNYMPFLTEADYTNIGIGSTQSGGRFYFVILLAAPIQLTAPGTDASVPGGASQQAQAAEILRLLNDARVAQGMNPLTIDATLTATALQHSQDQAAMDVMSHTGSDGSQPADRAQANGYVYSMVGENVLMRNDRHASGAFDQWWNSPPHYENMMTPGFTEIGIAFEVSSTGRYYYTMVLGAPR